MMGSWCPALALAQVLLLGAAPAALGSSMATLVAQDGQTFEFTAAFLRENLRESIDKSSLQRLSSNLPKNLTVVSASPKSNRTWSLQFSDGKVGSFVLPPAAPAPASVGRKLPRELAMLGKRLWGGPGLPLEDLQSLLETPAELGGLRFSYEDLHLNNTAGDRAPEQIGDARAQLPLAAARGRAALFEALQRYGLAIIRGAPAEPDAGRRIADELVGAVSATVFGYVFTIKAVKDPINLAYDSIPLQQHNDLPYYQKVPDIEVFSCIRDADSGGASLFLDGFAAAEALRESDPDAFELLASTPVHFMDLTDRWDMVGVHPTLELDKASGELQSVYFNERTRDSWRQWHPEAGDDSATAPGFYRALRAFEDQVERRDWYAEVALKPGEVVLFDNHRVMHSRTGFVGERHMEGCYIDWEGVSSTWKALQRRLHGEEYAYCGNVVGRPDGDSA